MPLLSRFSQGRIGTAELDSIVRNLNHVLNSKCSFSSLIDSFGVADPSHFVAGQAAVIAMTREIRRSIEDGEPRIRLLEIRQIPASGDAHLCLEMTCQIETEKKPLYLTVKSLSELSVGTTR